MARNPAHAWLALAVLSVGGGLTGCGAKSSAPPPAVTDAAARRLSVDADLVTSNNAFGFDVFGQLAQADAAKNVFVSPASVALALEIAANGAKGDTLGGMLHVLHLTGKGPPAINTANAALQASLISTDPRVQLNIANSLWLHKDRANVIPAFVTVNATYYGSEIGDLAGAPDSINAWAGQHTNGKIKFIAVASNYDRITAVIVNAVYFKGKWTTPFKAALTRPTPFTRPDGTTVRVQMMSQSGVYGYYKGAGFQAARLPYGEGRMSLIVALPNKETRWKTFLANLSGEAVIRWIARFKARSGDIGLPRFASQYGADLNVPLTTLGMGMAFDPARADLTGIAPNVYIDSVIHKTFLKVDEEGTEAAAVTAIEASAGASSIPNFQMTMDRPFFCAIRDDKTGELLFIGGIVDPTASGS